LAVAWTAFNLCVYKRTLLFLNREMTGGKMIPLAVRNGKIVQGSKSVAAPSFAREREMVSTPQDGA